MQQTFMTRTDSGVGDGVFDSIAWIHEVHLRIPDKGKFNSAVLFGNEDAPERIHLWKSDIPTYGDAPDYTWYYVPESER